EHEVPDRDDRDRASRRRRRSRLPEERLGLVHRNLTPCLPCPPSPPATPRPSTTRSGRAASVSSRRCRRCDQCAIASSVREQRAVLYGLKSGISTAHTSHPAIGGVKRGTTGAHNSIVNEA